MPIFKPEMETLAREDLQELQIERLQIVVNKAYTSVDFYRRKFDEAGLSPDDIKTLRDLRKVPFTTRRDLMENYPYGMFAVPLRDVVRLQFPLGIYGNPIVIGYTREDLKIWRELVARIMVGIGITEHDIIQVAFNYGLFMGAIRFSQSAELIGAAVVPSSIASADLQIRILQDFRSTVLTSTPSFALHIMETLQSRGLDPKMLALKIGLFGAEPWPETVREALEANLGIKAYDIYGVMELIEPGVAGECPMRNGLHIFEDHFLPEVVDPQTGEVLEDEREGELVLTTLTTSAYPLLRYRTRDITRLSAERCACGRTHRRILRVTGRNDDMLIIRGVNVFPSQIEQVLMDIPGVAPHYQVVLTRQGALDNVEVHVEVTPDFAFDEIKALESLQARVRSEIMSVLAVNVGVTVHVEVGFGAEPAVVNRRS